MRSSNKVIQQVIRRDVTASFEEIVGYTVADGRVSATVAYMDGENETIVTEMFIITGEMFDLLMSERPEFAPLKPAGEFRTADLWYFIDKLRE